MTGPHMNHVEARSNKRRARQYVSESHGHKPDAPTRTESRSAAKPTPGPWKWTWENMNRDWAIVTDVHGSIIANVNTETGPDACFAPATRWMPAEANARLIAEAGTVAHETGLTPRQLAEQRDELLEALQWALAEIDGRTSYQRPDQKQACNTKARTALAKAEGGAA
ncbi:hypothetical protein [Afipia carboxidovorans]|uniref:hypothetical protein n=1 Tax=Afipia carboxidovorans TaxID=40137 RepID=UPI0030932562|nr:hypothetical protein CRBSH125_09940 [Afipia carboxidovorans]